MDRTELIKYLALKIRNSSGWIWGSVTETGPGPLDFVDCYSKIILLAHLIRATDGKLIDGWIEG